VHAGAAGVERLQRPRHEPVQHSPVRRQEALVGEFPDAVVAELELLPHASQHPAAHQLLQTFGGAPLSHVRRAREQRQRERPADDGGRGDQALAGLAQAIEPAGDGVADPVGHRQLRGR
jgi:hypothetical protein